MNMKNLLPLPIHLELFMPNFNLPPACRIVGERGEFTQISVLFSTLLPPMIFRHIVQIIYFSIDG